MIGRGLFKKISLIVCGLGLLPTYGIAKEEESFKYAIIFINFQCSYCQVYKEDLQIIEAKVLSKGGKFRIVPLPNDSEMVKERVFFAIKRYYSDLSVEVAKLILDKTEKGISFTSIEDLVYLIKNAHPKIKVQKVIDLAGSNYALHRIKKGVRWFNNVDTMNVPAILLSNDGDLTRIKLKEDKVFNLTEELLEEVSKW